MIEQVKGTRNLFGADSAKYVHIFNTFCEAFIDYGYELVELPILEHKESVSYTHLRAHET